MKCITCGNDEGELVEGKLANFYCCQECLNREHLCRHCGSSEDVHVYASQLGPTSDSSCKRCASKSVEDFRACILVEAMPREYKHYKDNLKFTTIYKDGEFILWNDYKKLLIQDKYPLEEEIEERRIQLTKILSPGMSMG